MSCVSAEQDLKMQLSNLAPVLVDFFGDGGILGAEMRVPLELRANAIGRIHFYEWWWWW
jgi:hypothetical protein